MSVPCALACGCPPVDDAGSDHNARAQEEFLSTPTFPQVCATLRQVYDSLTKDSAGLSVYYDYAMTEAIEMQKIVECVQGLQGLVDIRINVICDRWDEAACLAALIAEKHTLRSVAISALHAPSGFLRPYASALSLQTNLEYLVIQCAGLPCELVSLLSCGQWHRLRYLSLEVVEGELLHPSLWRLPSLETLKLTCMMRSGHFDLKHLTSLKDVSIMASGRVTVCFGRYLKRLELYGDVVVDDCCPQLAFLELTNYPDPVSLFLSHQKTVRELAIRGNQMHPPGHFLNSIAIDGSVLQFLSLDHIFIDTLYWASETHLEGLSLVNVFFKDTPVLQATRISLWSSDVNFFRAFYENPALLIGTTRLGLDCDDPSLPLDAIEKITKPVAETLVFFATRFPFASLPKLPRLKYLGLGTYADVLTAMPSIDKSGRLQVLGVFDPESTLDEAVRSLLPKMCRTLTVQKRRGPVVEGCAVEAKPFFTPNSFWLEFLDFKPQILRFLQKTWY